MQGSEHICPTLRITLRHGGRSRRIRRIHVTYVEINFCYHGLSYKVDSLVYIRQNELFGKLGHHSIIYNTTHEIFSESIIIQYLGQWRGGGIY